MANHGQTNPEVRFVAQAGGYSLGVGAAGALISLVGPSAKGDRTSVESFMRPSAQPAIGAPLGAKLRMRLVGGDPRATVVPEAPQDGRVNYLIGDDPAKWHTNLPTYSRVVAKGVYRGVDLAWYGNSRGLEYDFIVAPGSNPARIRLAFDGAKGLQLERSGDLLVHTDAGILRQRAPQLYQELGGRRSAVRGQFVLGADKTVGFAIAPYDHTRSLVIDPRLEYSTFIGGSDIDLARGLAVDAAGHAYITGLTASRDFPTAGSGPFQTARNGANDAFVVKLTPTGSALVYATYLGGGAEDEGQGIAVNPSCTQACQVHVVGTTSSADFPVGSSSLVPFQSERKSSPFSDQDLFVARLRPPGVAAPPDSGFAG